MSFLPLLLPLQAKSNINLYFFGCLEWHPHYQLHAANSGTLETTSEPECNRRTTKCYTQTSKVQRLAKQKNASHLTAVNIVGNQGAANSHFQPKLNFRVNVQLKTCQCTSPSTWQARIVSHKSVRDTDLQEWWIPTKPAHAVSTSKFRSIVTFATHAVIH